MNRRLEMMISNYHQKKREQDSLAHQIANFKGVTAVDVIDSMYTPKVGGERVKSSNLSDKTAQIALSYQEKMERINREWYEYLERKLNCVVEEIREFEAALESLPEPLAGVMRDMIIQQHTWDTLASDHHVCRAMISKYRKKAITLLSEIYDQNDRRECEYLLS